MPATLVTIHHPITGGSAVVTEEAFHTVWQGRGWTLVPPAVEDFGTPLRQRGAWSDTANYHEGDLVSDGSVLYVATAANVDALPSSHPLAWESFGESAGVDLGMDVQALTLADPLTVGAGGRPFRFPFDAALLGFSASAGGAPVGSAAIFDVNKNGTTVYTTQGNRPTIAAGATFAPETVPDTTAVAEGDLVTVDRDAIGATPAIGVTVFMRYRRIG